MSERTMQALRDRINARLQTSAISRDRASAAGREVVAQCRQSDVETLEWVLSEIDAALATPETGGEGEVLYRKRCGWCGAYEGTVDPKEPCAKDEIGYIGPHQFEVLEAVVSGSGTPPGEGKVRVAAAAYLDALDEYRQECRTRDIPLAEYDYHEWRRLAEPVTVAERRLHEALRSAPTGETEGDRALWSDVDVWLSALERMLYAEEGDSPDCRAVVSLRDRVRMKLRATPHRQERER